MRGSRVNGVCVAVCEEKVVERGCVCVRVKVR